MRNIIFVLAFQDCSISCIARKVYLLRHPAVVQALLYSPARPERRRPVEYTSVAGVLTGQAGHFELYRCIAAFRGKRQGQLAGIPPVQNVNVRFRNTNGLVVGAISKGCEYLWLVFSPKGLQGIGISADVYVSDLRQTR